MIKCSNNINNSHFHCPSCSAYLEIDCWTELCEGETYEDKCPSCGADISYGYEMTPEFYCIEDGTVTLTI